MPDGKQNQKDVCRRIQGSRSAVVAEVKQSAPEASRGLGIGESAPCKWLGQIKPSDGKGSKGTRVNGGLKRLRSGVVGLEKGQAWTKGRQSQRRPKANAVRTVPGGVRSGHHAWGNNPQPARDGENIRLGGLAKKPSGEGRNTYGGKRIQDGLNDWSEQASKRRVGL